MRKLFVPLLLLMPLINAASRPGAVFLMIWPGARSTAMSGAFSALADDATACYYNQGGLAYIDGMIASLQHSNWLSGLHPNMYYEYAGFTKSIKKGTLGFNVIYLTTGKTEVRDFEGNYLGEYTTFDIAVGANYGVKLNERLGLGAGWKFIYSYLVAPWVWLRIPDLGIRSGGIGIAYAFDLGALYKPASFLSLSAALQNMGPGISYTETGRKDPLPITLRLGVKVQPVSSRVIKVNLTGEVTKVLVGMFADPDQTFLEKVGYEFEEAWKGIGLELDYFNFIILRGGYFYDKEGARIGLTYGGGVRAGGFSLDVGIDQAIYEFSTSNTKFSISYYFK